jgi:hypothetical protein
MFYGVSGNNEYVEIFNPSFSRSVNLTNFAIKYHTSLPDTLVSAGMGLSLFPRSYAVIFEGDYNPASGIYKNSVPQGALMLKIKGSSFGSSGMSNSTGRRILLIGSQKDTLDSYTYSADNKAGVSDEKIVPEGNNSPSNWTNSLVSGGTPAQKNSVTPKDFDISLSFISLQPEYPRQAEALKVGLSLKNSGLMAADSVLAEAFLKAGMDSTADLDEKVYSAGINGLPSSDSANLTFTIPGLAAGSYQLMASASFRKDEFPGNNKKILRFRVAPPAGNYNDLVINEIMFAPSPGEPEWIELFNASNSAVNLKKWTVSDRVSHAALSQKDIFLLPGGFIVLCRDSTLKKYYDIPSGVLTCSLPQLNNSGDMIVIRDSAGLTIDSLEYNRPITNGRSLERIDAARPSDEASNWEVSLSPFKATPGKANSVGKTDYDLALCNVSTVPERPFAGSRIALLAKVKNTGRKPAVFRLQLFESINADSSKEEKLSESGLLNLNSLDSLSYQFDYSSLLHNERSFIVRILWDKDENPSNNERLRKVLPAYAFNTLVVSEIMYMPESPEPEWIELFNSSPDSVNIKNWTITDVYSSPSQVLLGSSDLFLQPGGFVVFSKDSSIYSVHKEIPSKLIRCNLPPLNNDKDGVILKDGMEEVIDSVLYTTPPGSKAGHSLERRHASEPSASGNNWAFSKSPSGSTPGQVNSITPKDYDLAVENISTYPENPVTGDDITLNVKISNCGLKDASGFSVKMFYRDYNSQVYNSLETSEDLSLKKSDTLTLSFEDCLKGLKKGVFVAALISFDMDKDTTNDYLQSLVEPGSKRNALVINEVMFAPRTGESEWIELFNASNDTLDLKGWKAGNLMPSASQAKITTVDAFVYPGEFIILARDSSFIRNRMQAHIFITPFSSLNNAEDIILISDIKGSTIDSLHFKGTWCGRKYSSIERFSLEAPTNDSTNWMASADAEGSTPGRSNSAINLTPYARNSVVINELMYEPGKGNSEFIELYNAGTAEADLSNWKVTDKNGNSFYITDGNFVLPKGGYFLIAPDSLVYNNYKWLKDSASCSVRNMSSLGLSNSGGLILLKDAFRNTIDSVYYFSSWHSKTVQDTKNRSLERINPLLNSNDPSNWRTSVAREGASPGRLNSIFVLNQKCEARFSILPNPFSPDDDGLEDFTIINYNLSENVNSVILKIFDSQGRLVRTIVPGVYGNKGSLIFDGLSDNGDPLRMGIYIILLQALNSNNIVSETIKSVVVVARRL